MRKPQAVGAIVAARVTSLYEEAFMVIAARRAQTMWEGPLASGVGMIRTRQRRGRRTARDLGGPDRAGRR
jgi:hypothetical protein